MKKINPGQNQSKLFLNPILDAKGDMIKKRINNNSRKSNSEE